MKASLVACAIVACISVVHAAITVDAGLDQTVDVGTQVTITASYADEDADQTHAAEIDWGSADADVTSPGVDEDSSTVTGTATYTVPGTYDVIVTVRNSDDDQISGDDTLQVTVKAMPVTIGFSPNTLNAKSNGVLTVFLTPQDWWSEADLGQIRKEALNKDMVSFLGALPFRINFCKRDGGTFILKFHR
jgi:hypothetical protein